QRDGTTQNQRVSKLFGFVGLKRTDITEAHAGDIVAVAGMGEVQIGETITDPTTPEALPLIAIEEPTLQMAFSVNNGPFVGREGEYVTSRQLGDRLYREIKSNVSLRVENKGPDVFSVSGRGELHLSILIETMRREGYEFCVSKPEVITKDVDGQKHEPLEQLVLDVPSHNAGGCIEKLNQRRGELLHMETKGDRTLIEFAITSRGLMGFRSEFIRLTKGEGMMTHAFKTFTPWVGEIGTMRSGVLVSHEQGDATGYAIKNLEDRGQFFIPPGTKVYRGMIVGENSRGQDLVVNVCRTKKLTNIRSATAEVMETLATPLDVTLEFALDYIAADEMIEVTPQNIRLRKANLNFKS
ncbi:MAG: translational GTPase TypA, partial [Cyanobacteria bacterium HKST-UBA06]|nr:translational GTPase TypA [Cyanobacteria bacterium HKST-UBA06]